MSNYIFFNGKIPIVVKGNLCLFPNVPRKSLNNHLLCKDMKLLDTDRNRVKSSTRSEI